MNYSQDPKIEAASSLVITTLQEFYEQGRISEFAPQKKKEEQIMTIIDEIKNKGEDNN